MLYLNNHISKLLKESWMKIAIASEENKDLESRAAHHFGRCPYYVFITVDDDNTPKTIESLENPFFNGHEPGVVPQFIADQKADVIIAGGMGPRAIDWFTQLGVKAVTSSAPTVGELMNKYLTGEISSAESCHDSQH